MPEPPARSGPGSSRPAQAPWSCVPQQVTSSPATSQPVPAGSGSHGMPGPGLSKGQGWMLFSPGPPKVVSGNRKWECARRRDFPGISPPRLGMLLLAPLQCGGGQGRGPWRGLLCAQRLFTQQGDHKKSHPSAIGSAATMLCLELLSTPKGIRKR